MQNPQKKSPMDSWNMFDIFLLSWTKPLLNKASKNEITIQDMPNLDKTLQYTSYVNKIRFYFEKLRKGKKEVSKFFIVQLTYMAFKYEILLYFTAAFLFELIDFMQIVIMQMILRIQEDPDQSDSIQRYTILIVALFLMLFLDKIADTWGNFRVVLFSTKISYSISRLVLDRVLSYQ